MLDVGFDYLSNPTTQATLFSFFHIRGDIWEPRPAFPSANLPSVFLPFCMFNSNINLADLEGLCKNLCVLAVREVLGKPNSLED